ncbi:hypothetical protein QN372_14560 [Undibacterium sp. RTI2.1]|uniref:hypothetical protein n=1 Tax=unclassified Undibacterium TaxID=2630295 RepID=UPI002AB471B5|nr:MULTISPECIES: hypothetical protein [unclassified Undibacterium]MDY7538829.1 hypothetical protein [Undibacterium sp. 5I1]MEB0031979.1 hypothetical protein [Undibacterium sp. RTI2.1]MEB0118188.1 hypothetical protein [Undibacterium sp. RTI2.2]MEB0231828.1 hypothetical protein [Undibacterium sp. 10I3]MEB0258914.1 hypothetical protein [Undibacterium sp. 5I1]
MRRQLLSIAALTFSLCAYSQATWAASSESSSSPSVNITISKELLSKHVHIEHRKSDLNFALVRNAAGVDSIFYCDSSDVRRVEKLKSSKKIDFLWFKQAGKTYLVQDPAILTAANNALRDVYLYSGQMTQLGLEMGAQGASMGALGIKMAASVFMTDSGKKMDAIGKQMDDMGKQMDAFGKKMENLNTQEEAAANAAVPGMLSIFQDALASGKATAL